MTIYNKIKEKKREITLIAVTTMVLVLFFTGFSIGKSLNHTKLETNAEIAEPILVVENGPTIQVTAMENKGYYDFKVKNYNENGDFTQIDLEYSIEIISHTDESIAFNLYKDDEKVALNNQISEKFILSKQGRQEHTYKLEIIYDKTKVTSVSDIIEDIQIKIHSEQVKI